MPNILDHISIKGDVTGIKSEADARKIVAETRKRLERMGIKLPPRSTPNSFAVVVPCDRYTVDSWRIGFVFNPSYLPVVGWPRDEARAAEVVRVNRALHSALLNVVRPSHLIENPRRRLK